MIPDIQGAFRKHLSVIEGEDGLVRIYNGVEDDRVEVHVSGDGVHFEDRDTGLEYRGHRNIAVPEATATGNVLIDPNAPSVTEAFSNPALIVIPIGIVFAILAVSTLLYRRVTPRIAEQL